MEIKIPEVGESVREALLARWFKKNGDSVKRDEPVCEIETDKITLDLNADADGILTISLPEGSTVPVGTTIGRIEEPPEMLEKSVALIGTQLAEKFAVPPSSPSLRNKMREQNVSPDELVGSGRGGRILPDDLQTYLRKKSEMPPASRPSAIDDQARLMPEVKQAAPVLQPPGQASHTAPEFAEEPIEKISVGSEDAPKYASGRVERRPMTPLRKRIAERLLAARQQTAMLTTFSEADLSNIKILRSNHRENFIQRYGIALGYMPFFVKACIEALKVFPSVNASIDGDDIVYHHFYDISVAIGGEKGLVVPVLRNADQLELYEIDQGIAAFTEKIKTNKLAISDLEGGTFTISNGGVYGSMLSTPILNPPQSAVLGMHAIQERPVVRDGQIVIRPMMYLALSYDHRVIDGREAVGFLKKVKEYIEEPEEHLLEA